MNNSVQKLVGEDIRVVLGFPDGTGPMPHPPYTAFITEKIDFLIFGWVTKAPFGNSHDKQVQPPVMGGQIPRCMAKWLPN